MMAFDRISGTVREIEHCWIPMPDGVRLSARLWLPERAEPSPAILEYIPYRKRDMVRARDERNHPVFARAGYASLRVDMRGSGDSEGVMTDMYTSEELSDARAVIDWIAAQPWCDGSVGMMGTSWGGIASLQAAAARPAHLKAVIAVCATDNRFEDDIHHMGGAVLTDTLEWGAALPAILALPPDRETVGPGWREQWMARLEAAAFPLERWLRHGTRDAYWRHGSVGERPGAIRCPTLAIGGWVDRYSNSVMNLLADNPETCWGVVGPWGHHYPDHAEPGPGIDFQRLALDWWDRWLRRDGARGEAPPRLRVWMGAFDPPTDRRAASIGRWVTAGARPEGHAGDLRLGLDSGGRLCDASAVQGDRTSDRPPEDQHVAAKSGSGPAPGTRAGGVAERPDREPSHLEVPPSLTAGLAVGDTGYFGRVGGLPAEQSEADAESLTFETPPLPDAFDLLGRAELSLGLHDPASGGVLSARLVDVAPDGRAALVSHAVRNLALDDSLATQRKVGAPVRIRFPNIAHRFAEGHRIRLSLSMGCWPQIWPGTDGRAAIRPADCGLCLPRATLSDAPHDLPVLPVPSALPDRSGPLRRNEVGPDGTWVAAWHQPPAGRGFPEIGVAIGSETLAEHRIDPRDPRRAESRFIHRLMLDWSDETITTMGESALVSDGDAPAELTGRLEVRENGAIVFERAWRFEIALNRPRDPDKD